MSEIEQHQKIKYGDIIYIEFSSKDHTRNILKANGFNMVGKNFIEVEQLNITSDNIFLKDFINNLFIIFPKMKEDFIKNKSILEEKLELIKDKVIYHVSSFDNSVELKDNMTKLITAYQKIKQDVYNEKDLFLKDIGQPILFKKDFILIHFESQNFVTFNPKTSKLVLTENYSDECIFLFMPWSSLDSNNKNVFSNQNLYICKKDKNMWSNNHFLTVKENTSTSKVNANESLINNITNNAINNITNNNILNDTSKFENEKNTEFQKKLQKSSNKLAESKNKEEQSRIDNNYINTNNINLNNNYNEIVDNKFVKKYVLGFAESQSTSNSPFKIKICSNYIDPSSGLLSFSAPVWFVCQSIEKHLTIRPNFQNDVFATKRRNEFFGGFNLDKETEDERKFELNVTNRRRADSTLKSKKSSKFFKNREKFKSTKKLNNYIISFDSIDKNNSLNNIYGLFYVEQCELSSELSDIKDENMKKKMKMRIDLKLSSFVQYHKCLRFLHATTHKYLGFKESTKATENDNIINPDNVKIELSDFNNDKISGSLILSDKPDEDCYWMFMESYKILDEKLYYESKSNGIEFKTQEKIRIEKVSKKEEDDINKKNKKKGQEKGDEKEENVYKIKNKEILRIFHVKSQKFLCFDEINNKLNKNKMIKTNSNKGNDDNLEEKRIIVQNLSLSKTPYDCDLIRLVPSNADQSWEIRLVLYFSDILTSTIQAVVNDFDQFFKNNPYIIRRPSKDLGNNTLLDNNNITINNNKTVYPFREKPENRLKTMRDNIFVLRRCFKNLRDYCLNNYTRKFDTTMSAGKPIFYRQQFLYDQRFLEKTFYFLDKAKDILSKYNEPLKIPQQKMANEDNNININKENRKVKLSTPSVHKNNKPIDNNLLIDIWKYLNDSVKFSFQFISAMCKDHPENKRRVYRENNEKNLFIHFLLDYEDASKCFLDIIKDNEKVMNSLSKGNNNNNNKVNFEEENDNDNVIGKVLTYLNKCDNYDTKNLSTLSKFLKTGDVGITSNQQYIFEEIFINGKDRFLLKIKPLYDDIKFLVIFKNDNDTYVQKSLIEFSNTQIQYEQKIIKYLAVQLNLFADLCYGRNYVCIEKIREIFPLDHLIYHISKVDINQEILEGLINILNFTYIDIEPHIITVYPSLIKVINSELKVERVNKGKVRTYIPLDKLNLILCLSLFTLNNIKYGKIVVNSANINMILNIIKLRLYENVVYTPMDISEVENEDLNRKLHNLKDEVKYNVIHGEEILMNKSKYTTKKSEEGKEDKNKEDNDEEEIEEEKEDNMQEQNINNNKNEKGKRIFDGKNLDSFYYKFGYKYIEFNFENPTGEEYLLFVLDRINDFFLNNLIINNIDDNTENKNIVTQNFKNTSNNDILTQSNINYLMEKLKELKDIFSRDKDNKNNEYKSILKQIEKVINYILDIKKEDMSIYLLENFLKANNNILMSLFNSDNSQNSEKIELNTDILSQLKRDFFESPNINKVLLDDEYYYYQLFKNVKCSYNIPKIFSTFNNNNGGQNILLGGNNNEKVNENLLNNSLFSEEQTNQKYYIDISEIENINNDKNKDDKESMKYKDEDYFYSKINKPIEEINLDIFYMNAVIFKDLQELIIRILEMNINDKLTKVLIRMFTRLMSQRKEIFDCLKNVLLLYKREDLDKYYQCDLSIVELGLLGEKTEKWMTKERVLDNIKSFRDLDEVNVNDIKPEQKDFFAVYYTLYKFIYMLKDKYTGDYLSLKEVKLIQTIFHSFQLENILSSLLREITQEFPDDNTEKIVMKHENNYNTNNINNIVSKPNSINNEVIKEESSKGKNRNKNNEKELRIRDRLMNYKTSLEKLIKEIFCLFEALVHKSSPNDSIMEVIEFTVDYKYFKDLGLNKLITELSYDNKYLKLKTSFLIDILKEQLKQIDFKDIKNKYLGIYEIKEYKEKKEYKKALKKAILSLKLMKNLVTKLSETNYLDILRAKYLDILEDFDIIKTNNLEGSLMTNTVDDKKNSIYLYSLQISYYLLTIALRFSRKSQRLKENIRTIINTKNIKKLFMNIPFPLTIEKIQKIITKKLEKSTKIVPQLKFYYKLKSVSIELYYFLGHNIAFQTNKIGKHIINMYETLKEDLKYLNDCFSILEPKKNIIDTKNNINNNILIEETITDGYELIVASFKKSVYKYFLNGLFPVLYNLNNRFNNTSESQNKNEKNDFRITEKKWQNFIENHLYKEKDIKYFNKVFKILEKKEEKLKKFFGKINIPIKKDISRSETNLAFYRKKYIESSQNNLKIKKKKNNDNNNNEDKNLKPKEILFNLNMEFTSYLLNDIENNQVITDSIDKESMVLAKNLKSKINFHSILKRSSKENEVNMEDLVESNQTQEKEMHLANVFLKFIQENYKKSNYSEEINSLIELMGNIIEVPPEILPEDLGGIEYDFYYKDKINELKDIFSNHMQKLFLNNGSIEIFLKIACEGNKILDDNTFPIIIHFFNNLLEGGNTDVQKKFTQLFQTLPNSDNFFLHIKDFINKDIFENLKNRSNIMEPKIDMENLNTIKDILRYLQLLAENHNTVLQNFLREQTTNRLSYNFVNILVEYLSMLLGKLSNIYENNQEFTEYFINLYYERFLSCLDTIIEFLQGPCLKNQEYLISTKIIESFDKILGEILVDTGKNDQSDTKNDLINGKKETQTVEMTTFGIEKSKTAGFTTIIEGDDIIKKNDSGKKKKTPSQNRLFSKLTDYQKSLFIFKISLVFLSIIEGRKTKDDVIKKILRDFDYELIFKKSREIYAKLEKECEFFLYIDENCKEYSEAELQTKIVSEAGFNLYFLIQNLLNFEKEDTEFQKYASFMNKDVRLNKEQMDSYDNFPLLKKSMDFYSENSVSIEILKDNIVFKVYCPKLSFFDGFDENNKKKFEDNAKRTSLQTKLMSLMNEKDKIYHKIKQLYTLQKKFKEIWILNILFAYPNEVQNVGFALNILMNILIFIGYNTEKDTDRKDVIYHVEFFGIDDTTSKLILMILGILIAFFSFIKLFEFVTREAILIFKTLYTDHLKELYEERINQMSDLEIHRIKEFLNSRSYKKMFIYIRLIFNIKVIYALLYMIFAVLGIVEHNFFFAFHLIEFIISQPILQYVFRAIIDPIAQLAYTFIFFFILIYFYSLIIFYYFQDIMPENSCDSPVICMVFIYSNTFTSGGNLGNFIDEGGNENKEGNMIRYALDISYTIIMVGLTWQMVSGLIVDTFESLRGSREDKEEDMKSKCFICGLDKEKIEKYYPGKEGFEKHLQDHSVANYFFYTFYLEDKESSEYSGLESYIKDQIDNESISWFPKERSLKIEEWESKHKITHDA